MPQRHYTFIIIYVLAVFTFVAGLIAVSPTALYKLLAAVLFVLLFLAYRYRSTRTSYFYSGSALLVHHGLLAAMVSYQSVSVDLLTPFIINSAFLYVPVLPKPFYALPGIGTLACYFLLYKHDGDFWLVIVKMIVTLLITVLLAAGIRFLQKLAVERDRFYRTSITDSVTGLYTFTHTIHLGQRLLEEGNRLIAVLIDMDDFKNINDTYGHFTGNKVLIQFAAALVQVMGPDVVVGRLGGDEFIALIRDSGQDEESIRRKMDQLKSASYITDPELVPIHISFSYGFAKQDLPVQPNVESLISLADKNMYSNKFSQKTSRTTSEIDADIPKQFLDLLHVLSQKDMYTFVHSLYVAKYGAVLAETTGMNAEEVDQVRLAGWLHDIGKLAIPNEILRKPGALNRQECQTIKNHVLHGLNLLRSFAVHDRIITAIAEHHERYDGKGYPAGRGREEISLAGRILAIVDAYSAMTIKRVYRRNQLSPMAALQKIENEKGRQFDPILVERFAGILMSERAEPLCGGSAQFSRKGLQEREE